MFLLHSEEDLERALGAYAKQSHSSTTVFLDSSSKPESKSTVAPPTSGSTRTRTVLKASESDQLLRKRESVKGAVKRQESTMSVQSIETTSAKENLLSNSGAPARYAWLTEHAVEDDSLTSALPKYSQDMLESSDLPLSSKASLEKLTQSLQTVGKVPSSVSQSGGRRRMRTTSATARLTPHKRSLSVQSLASTASSADSGIYCEV